MSALAQLRSRSQPGSPAIRFRTEVLSYDSLWDRVDRTAGWLADQGVAPGDVIAVRLPKGLDFLALHLGAMGIGAAILPLHPAATADELAFRVADANVRLTVLDIAPDVSGCTPRSPIDLPEDTTAVLLYTSGTTGTPKGAPISHGNLLAMVKGLHAAWHWTDADVLLHALPVFHVHGLFVAQWGAMWAGASAIWLDRFDVDAVWAELPNATVFMGVPTYYARLLAAGPRAALPAMRLFTSGSAPLPAAHHGAFAEAFGHRILERYGMTEIGIVLSNPYDGERRPGSVGFPLPGIEVRIAAEDDIPLASNETGEIQIRGDSVFAGYLGRPDATTAALADGWMHTGDLGHQDDDGYIHITGRRSDMILSGGMNVYPREIEAELLVRDDITECAVFGVPDADLGQRVAVAVVGTGDEATWSDHLRGRVAPYKIPRRWFQLPALPRNTMGKIQRAALRTRFGVIVRDAMEDDVDFLTAGNVALAAETEHLTLDIETVRSGVEKGLTHATYLVAERLGEPVGQLMLTSEWSDRRDGWIWWIRSVHVRSTHRRHGVLRALHDTVRARARAAGVLALRLAVDHGDHGAIATAARVGMHPTGYRIHSEDLGHRR